ncbi:Uncharacterised protein [Mycobacteroides abscessus subsp. massiliense]|nr:Uncharacterised protein [Mycobacteroides abscessus subsp. massiliense]
MGSCGAPSVRPAACITCRRQCGSVMGAKTFACGQVFMNSATTSSEPPNSVKRSWTMATRDVLITCSSASEGQEGLDVAAGLADEHPRPEGNAGRCGTGDHGEFPVEALSDDVTGSRNMRGEGDHDDVVPT